MERGSEMFRAGVRDGESGRPARTDLVPGTFAHYDYLLGFYSGQNNVHWDAVYAGRACDIRTRRCGRNSNV